MIFGIFTLICSLIDLLTLSLSYVPLLPASGSRGFLSIIKRSRAFMRSLSWSSMNFVNSRLSVEHSYRTYYFLSRAIFSYLKKARSSSLVKVC